MSTAAVAASTNTQAAEHQPQAAPEVAQVAAPAPAANDASVIPTAAPAANDAVAESTAIVPPKTEMPKPTPPVQHTQLVDQPNPNQAEPLPVAAQRIEQHLSTFIGDRLPAGVADGLMVDVTLVGSNAVTSEGHPGLHDIAIVFKGGKLEDPSQAQTVAEQLRAALREHPAFNEMSFGGLDTKIEHMMRCSILALENEKLHALLTPQPRKHVTFIAPPATAANDASAKPAASGHCTGGPGCGHCTATKDVAAAAAPAPKPTEQPKPDTAATAPASADALAVTAPQPAVTENKPAELAATSPAVTQVAAPHTTIAPPGVAMGQVAAKAPSIAQSA